MSMLLPLLDIDAAARLLEAGKLVAFPTETVYGLGADAENPQAVADIYLAKGRPSNHPVIVHVAPEADIRHWAAEVPPEAEMLIQAFWPGPLTLILKRASSIPDAVAGGQDSIGVRCPSHPVAQALLRAFKQGRGGLAAPSANKFGRVSPTTAQHVREEFADVSLVAGVVEGGASDVGIESTIVDLTRTDTIGPVLLRPGHVSMTALQAVLGRPIALPDSAAPRASGTLASHYAPRTPVVQVDAGKLPSLCQQLAGQGKKVALIVYGQETQDAEGMVRMPAEAAGYAHHLYAALRDMDHVGADIIIVETPSQDAAWQGVNDRLRRAAHDSSGLLQAWGIVLP